MKKLLIIVMTSMASLHSCFAMKYHLKDTDIQESDFNNLMARDEQSLDERASFTCYRPAIEPEPGNNTVEHRRDQFDCYPQFAALVKAIKAHDERTALHLISVMTQEELNVRDYGRRTPLLIAIEEGLDNVALALVEAMNDEGLTFPDMEMCSALSYAYNRRMTRVIQIIENRLRDQ